MRANYEFVLLFLLLSLLKRTHATSTLSHHQSSSTDNHHNPQLCMNNTKKYQFLIILSQKQGEVNGISGIEYFIVVLVYTILTTMRTISWDQFQ